MNRIGDRAVLMESHSQWEQTRLTNRNPCSLCKGTRQPVGPSTLYSCSTFHVDTPLDTGFILFYFLWQLIQDYWYNILLLVRATFLLKNYTCTIYLTVFIFSFKNLQCLKLFLANQCSHIKSQCFSFHLCQNCFILKWKKM